MNKINELFHQELIGINIGLDRFAESLNAEGAKILNTAWKPPAAGDADLGRKLALLSQNEELRKRIDQANDKVMERILAAHPVLVDVMPASQAMGLEQNTLLHAGPPIEFENMAGPMRGAAIGALLFEGLSETPEEAVRLLESGKIQFSPCHHYRAVGPMAGLISASMPVFVVRDQAHGNMAYSNINEGLGKVLRFGAYSKEVIERMRWMTDVLAPILKQALAVEDPIDLRAITAKSLTMGDECHNRNVAASSLLYKELSSRLLKTDIETSRLAAALTFAAENEHFFLNLSMACSKAIMEAGQGVADSTVVTVMSRNGIEFGIQMSATGDRWFTAPANFPQGLYFPGYSEKDAALDIGDSSITETAGIGGFAMATAPAIVGFVGGSAQDALRYTREMRKITLRRNSNYALPSLDFEGTPTGIDAIRVLETGVAPLINTGIAHKEPGVGQIGAGIVRAPLECFAQAIKEYLKEHLVALN